MRPREILGLVRTVVFAPEDLALVRGEPAARRAFMDDLVIQRSPVMAGVKADFERVARQRAALMKSAQASARRGASPDLSTLDVWDQQFAHLSARLSAARAQAVASLAGPASRAYEVSDSPRRLVLSFEASVDRAIGTYPDDPASTDPCDAPAQERRTLAALAAHRDKEVTRGVNLVGAHRDELSLVLGGMPVKGYASHGESWSVALALRLGAFELLSEDGETPVLILDDVFAELDTARREGLAAMASRAEQAIITCAVEEDIPAGLDHRTIRIRMDAAEGSAADA